MGPWKRGESCWKTGRRRISLKWLVANSLNEARGLDSPRLAVGFAYLEYYYLFSSSSSKVVVEAPVEFYLSLWFTIRGCAEAVLQALAWPSGIHTASNYYRATAVCVCVCHRKSSWLEYGFSHNDSEYTWY